MFILINEGVDTSKINKRDDRNELYKIFRIKKMELNSIQKEVKRK